jgi:hypothetical protein
LPFEIGRADEKPVETRLIIPKGFAGDLELLTRGRGKLRALDTGDLSWDISYRDLDALVTFALTKGLKLDNTLERNHAIKGLHRLTGTL